MAVNFHSVHSLLFSQAALCHTCVFAGHLKTHEHIRLDLIIPQNSAFPLNAGIDVTIGSLFSAPHGATTPNNILQKGYLSHLGKQSPWVSVALLQLPGWCHSASWQQVQLGSLARSWQEGALSSTFHMRKSRHFAGILGIPNPSPRHTYTVLWERRDRREEDGFLNDSQSESSSETGRNDT